MFKGAVSGDFGPRPYHPDGLARMGSSGHEEPASAAEPRRLGVLNQKRKAAAEAAVNEK
jgi:hypothetical protein